MAMFSRAKNISDYEIFMVGAINMGRARVPLIVSSTIKCLLLLKRGFLLLFVTYCCLNIFQLLNFICIKH